MKKLTALFVILLIVTMLVVSSCATATEDEEQEIVIIERDTASLATGGKDDWDSEVESPPTIIVTVPTEAQGMVTGEQWATERMIVRTADISMAVEDVPAVIDQITVMAGSLGGYVVTSRLWQENERMAGSISIRVPSEYFDSAIRELRGLAVDVISERTSSQDVTEEYVDLTAQLENLEASEQQLLTIMEKAETVEEILEVQRELSRIRGDIEQIKARMQYLEQTSSTSLIQVQLVQSKLTIEFRASRATVKEREDFRLYAEIAGGFSPYSYEWDLGDGTTSTNENPTHSYSDDGSYTISLTVTDDRGNITTETRTDYITVIPGWSAGGIASSAWNGLVTFGRVLVDIFIWVGIFSPVWIVIGGIIIFWRRRRRSRS